MTSGTVIVLPSLTFPESELRKIIGIQYYEERLLFLLLLLRHEALRVVFVTSLRVEEPIVDYYLRFIPPEREPGKRLYLVALWDPEPRALTSKLLERPDELRRLKELGAGGESVLVVFNATEQEREVADHLGVSLYASDPSLAYLGYKSGSRRVAREAGVPVLPGAEDLYSVEDVEAALVELRREVGSGAAVIKLDRGFSGQGNAIVDLAALGEPLTGTRTVFCAQEESWSSYAAKIADEGAIVEQLVRVPGMRSPSVQLRIGADGSCEVVSTHDQILGGPDDQVYLGCRFPASATYRSVIQEHALRVAKVLSDRGVVGTFGIDFIVVPNGGSHDVFLSEINLRLGGTTHPFLFAKEACGARYDPASGELVADGRAKSYVATDNLKSERYVGLFPQHVIAAFDRTGLAFDRGTNTGVLLHLLGPLRRHGKIGLTCVADSPEEADGLYDLAVAELDRLADEERAQE